MKSQNRSWFALITFCTASVLVAGLGLAILFASATAAFAVGASVKAEDSQSAVVEQTKVTQNFAGVISDARCGARHASNSGRSPAECTRACVQQGQRFMLVDGDKAYALAGNTEAISKSAGVRITVAGVLEGDTIKVSAIDAAP